MISISRRQLADYAVEELLAGRQPAKLASRLAAVLIETGRRGQVDLLLSDIDQQLEDRGLVAKARATVVYPLEAKLKAKLAEVVKKATGAKQVVLVEQLDKDMLGGIRIETANHTWDKTARRELELIEVIA